MGYSFNSIWQAVWGITGIAAIVYFTGCASQRMTQPQRTATEQLLLSASAERAFDDLDLTPIKGRKVFLDTTYFDSYDKLYVIGTLRDRLISNDVYLVSDVKEAEIVVEARNGALSTDSSDSLIGIPEMPFPVPLTGVVKTPEVPLYKSQHQESIAKFALLAYDRETRQHVMSSGPIVGYSYLRHYHVLGIIKFRRTDIPEKKMLKPRR